MNAPTRPPAPSIMRHVHRALPHDSAVKHVSGTALYIDDMPEPAGLLHVVPGLSPMARGAILRLDLEAVRRAPGVVAVLTAADIPGVNDVSPSIGGDPLIAHGRVAFHAQVIFAVVADTRDQARRAARLAEVEIAAESPTLDVDAALARGETVLPDYGYGRGDAMAAISTAPHQLAGIQRIGGQEHFYLEGQVALAIPGEDGAMHVLASTQHPTEVQHVVARVLGLTDAAVTAEVRRMGGAFGGKESQATQWAALAALAARVTGRACKLRLDRDDDMALTGKRHDFRVDYAVGYDEAGVLHGYDVTFNARCGYSADLSQGVVDRTLFHADSAYFLPAVRLNSRRLMTNTVSNTAFRGFGGPQGMLAMERVIERVARSVGRDPLDVRKDNFYRPGRDIAPYGQTIEEADTGLAIVTELERSSSYRLRRRAIAAFNAGSPVLKKGLALTPVKFGISFTLMPLNQASALVHVYQDGSIHLNHGGTEMGQGLFIKVAQVVAEAFGVGLDRVQITATTTGKAPNTGPTAASAGTDLNAMAALDACRQIMARMAAHVAGEVGATPDAVTFRDDRVWCGAHSVAFSDLAKRCTLARVHLSAAGFYSTPTIHWDRATATGRPFLYYAWGAACCEVTIDALTGEMRLDRVDILHDCGRSLNPAIDIGQIEGGFVQGLGWLTTEELVHGRDGRLLTHAPSTYKIPLASDIPQDFRVALWAGDNPQATIHRSKAVGEPPVMLANATFCAILDACCAVTPDAVTRLEAPATPEAILKACHRLEGTT